MFLIKSADDLQKLYELKVKNLEIYANENDLRSDAQLRQFLKIRFNLFIRAHQQQQQQKSFDLDCVSSTLNILFIRRLIDSEISLIKCLNEYLPLNSLVSFSFALSFLILNHWKNLFIYKIKKISQKNYL